METQEVRTRSAENKSEVAFRVASHASPKIRLDLGKPGFWGNPSSTPSCAPSSIPPAQAHEPSKETKTFPVYAHRNS